jgi:hypothetical protein
MVNKKTSLLQNTEISRLLQTSPAHIQTITSFIYKKTAQTDAFFTNLSLILKPAKEENDNWNQIG